MKSATILVLGFAALASAANLISRDLTGCRWGEWKAQGHGVRLLCPSSRPTMECEGEGVKNGQKM